MGKCLIVSILVIFFISCGKKEYLDDKCIIKGETITFTAESYNTLWKDNISDLVLYGLKPDGSKIIYEEDVDYVVIGNKIKRTKNSKIVDFVNHKIIYDNNDKFKWSPEPNINPELTLPYQVYADYFYQPSTEIPQSLNNPIIYNIVNKLRSKHPIKIVVFGTSVTYGVHTFDRYYNQSNKQAYPQLISKAISRMYNSYVEIIDLSVNGGVIEEITDVTSIILEHPDLVMIEFGMNDHNGLNPNIAHYSDVLENAIKILIANNIEVILVGFFQQIERWELEYSENTISFNNVLKKLSEKYNIYFSDIYTDFQKIDKEKLYKDYTGDFMHHPTSFGHQLYYLSIMPYFIVEPISEQSLLKYIY